MSKKFFLVIVVLSIYLTILIGFISVRRSNQEQKLVCFENHCFEVELVTESEDVRRGLMFRDSLGQNRGMLFVFEKEGEYPFWMKNTLIPLDIIWIDEDKEVVFIKKNAQPCQDAFCEGINPGEYAKYVLEINGGISDTIGLSVGQKVNLEISSD